MVSCIILSRYQQGLDPTAQGRQKIAGGPLYPVGDVMPLLKPERIRAWTKGCVQDLQKWSMDLEDVAALLKLALLEGRYLASEWCRQQPNGAWAACDAYLVVERRMNDALGDYFNTEFYLKFAIGKTGQLILVVSSHPSGS
ncbi:hypothetical protein ACFO3I_07145 [Rheinheimera marina]|uniref:Uncharacterized protein n=1 Tax=Rheinheimera marina TaxID=1774958 RepID=A0ABV9JKK8_9GAMM